MLIALAASGCASVSTRTFGAASIDDLKAENDYISLVSDHLAKYADAMKSYAPNSTSPEGPCNKGGQAPDCIAADTNTIATLQEMSNAIGSAKIPPRFVDGDRQLRDALSKMVEGLGLRTQALQQSDGALWTRHAELLQAADAAWKAAYAAFPEDNRPPLGP